VTNLAVIFGGPSPEHDVSILTGLQAARALAQRGRDVIGLYWSKTGDWYRVPATLEGKDFVDGLPRGSELAQLIAVPGGGFAPTGKKGLFGKAEAFAIDTVVNACHGGPGEDGSLQGALDLAGLRYTGPTVAGAALGMDKLAFGGVVAAAGLPSLPRVCLTESTKSVPFDGPYILKPRFGGSSIGVEVVDSIETAHALLRSSTHLRAGAVVEPYKPKSIDLNVAVRMYPEPQCSAVEKPTRTVAAEGQILGYADKYVGGEGMASAPRELPADIPSAMTEAMRTIALRVAELLNVRGVQRIDFLADGDELYVNEINTIPGSLAKHLWVQPDIPFGELLEDMLAEAAARPSTFYTAAGADGSALRSAGNIAGKLS
jgi:D-alanine-D-alanine ligase